MKRAGRIQIFGGAGQVAAGDLHCHHHYWQSGSPATALPDVRWIEVSAGELQRQIRAEREDVGRAWRHYWFLALCFLMTVTWMGTTANLAVSAVDGETADLIEPFVWWLVASFVCPTAPAGIWIHRDRGRGRNPIAHAQENVHSLEAILATESAKKRLLCRRNPGPRVGAVARPQTSANDTDFSTLL